MHVQCAWRLSNLDGIVTGLRDLYYPAGDPDAAAEGWSPFKKGARSRLDERTEQLLSQWELSPPVVNSVSADALGGIRLSLTNGYALEVWPGESLPDEYWPVFEPSRGNPHFVVSGSGIDELSEQTSG